MKTSKELYTFFKEWLEWAEDGGEGLEFCSGLGLCSNLGSWCESHANEDNEYFGLLPDELANVLGYVTYPFGAEDYDTHQHKETMHKCPKRLAFVREQISKYEEA